MRNIMKSINTEITINASTEIVWKVLMDFENYSNWNPFVTRIEGEPVVGQKLSTTISPKGKKAMDFTPTVLANNENEEFRWVGQLLMSGIFDGEHYFQLEAIDKNTTRFIHGEIFRGILARALFGILEESTITGFNDMNEAIKAKAEHQALPKAA